MLQYRYRDSHCGAERFRRSAISGIFVDICRNLGVEIRLGALKRRTISRRGKRTTSRICILVYGEISLLQAPF